MKIIISIASMDETNKRVREALNETTTEFNAFLSVPAVDMARLAVAETADLKYVGYTLNEDESELTLEVSDEVILKYVGIYVKVVRAIMPFVRPMVTLAGTLRDEILEIVRMLKERK